MFVKPLVSEFKTFFSRDFPYAPYIPDPIDPINNPPTQDPSVGVTDADISKAMLEADQIINPGICPTQEAFTLWYMYITAHFLVMDLRAAAQGLESSFSWITTSKSVGSVSESYGVPARINDNPMFAMFSKTYYGGKYMTLVMPYLLGPVYVVHGKTTP